MWMCAVVHLQDVPNRNLVHHHSIHVLQVSKRTDCVGVKDRGFASLEQRQEKEGYGAILCGN